MSLTWYREEWSGQGAAIELSVRQKLHETQSAYQRIEVFETETFGRLLTLDGLVMLTERDHFIYHEMLAHPALMTHADPKRVLIVGGGDCGLLTEVVKHAGVERIDQIEIDRAVFETAERFFPEFMVAAKDPRSHLHFEDGAAWIRDLPAASCDLILIDSTDPVGPARQLFEAEFLTQCRRALRADGVLAMQSESPLFHVDLIADLRDQLRQAGFVHSATLSFPQCTYPSGWWSVTLAAPGPLDRFRTWTGDQTPNTRYYNAAVHAGALANPEFLRRRLAADR